MVEIPPNTIKEYFTPILLGLGKGRIVKGYKCPAQMILAGAPAFPPVQHNFSPYLTRSSNPGLFTKNISRKRSIGLRRGERGLGTLPSVGLKLLPRIQKMSKSCWKLNESTTLNWRLPIDELFWDSLLPGGGSPFDLHAVLHLFYLQSLC